ncbi:hypothetical protein L596_027145 [Steinernema carpocapsae]|uniref:Uncharacterized protein n=1 Tax=Steinernema carpocapsae TaxID=34508 RepID=A0A4U5M3H7_STECR|nr:hypothetical protein L596_027145 [Steinernema carpocapsae]
MDIAKEILAILNVKPDNLRFCRGRIDVLEACLNGNDRYRDMFNVLLDHKTYLSMTLFTRSEQLLNEAHKHHLAYIGRFEFLHTVVSLSCILKNNEGHVDFCLKTSFPSIKDYYLKLLTKGKEVADYNATSELPNFACTSSLISHYLRHGQPEGLSLSEYLNTVTTILWKRPPKPLRRRYPAEHKKFRRTDNIASINGKTQPKNRLWRLITKKIHGKTRGTFVDQICSICFCDLSWNE